METSDVWYQTPKAELFVESELGKTMQGQTNSHKANLYLIFEDPKEG